MSEFMSDERVIVTDPVDLQEKSGVTTSRERDGRVWVMFDSGRDRQRFAVKFVRRLGPAASGTPDGER